MPEEATTLTPAPEAVPAPEPEKEVVKPLYIGKTALTTVVRNEEANLVAVALADGRKEEYSLRQFDSVAKGEAYDDGLINVYKWAPAITLFLRELLADGMQMIDKDFILNRVDESLIVNYNRAIGKIFNVNDPFHVNAKMIDVVLKSEKVHLTFPEA